MIKQCVFLLLTLMQVGNALPLFYWNNGRFCNFGDCISPVLVERIVDKPFRKTCARKKKSVFAIGSILHFARTGDVIWGSGINGKIRKKNHYAFNRLDVRAVRGPLTKKYLKKHFNIEAPPVYGDPGLLFSLFFPEFKKDTPRKRKYTIIPHYSENHLFPKNAFPNVVYPTQPWEEVLEAICESEFVISSSLHGLILAESYGIPARMLRVTENEPLFKYKDYYLGSGRTTFRPAYSIEEALELGGEPPHSCDVDALLRAFPFDHF